MSEPLENTTLERVLIIAPELRAKVTNIAQINDIEVFDAQYETEYTVTLNDIVIEIISPAEGESENLKEEIIQLIYDELEDEEVLIENNVSSIRLKAVEPGQAFYLSVSDNLTLNNVTSNYNGQELFELLLEDVILQVTELNFKSEMERAQRYLLAHLLTLTNVDSEEEPDASDIIQETVGDISYRYGSIDYSKLDDIFYGKTPYGVVFYEIMLRRWFRFI